MIVNIPERGKFKIPEKTLVESASALFDTLRRGIPNVFSGIFPAPAFDKILWVTFSKAQFGRENGSPPCPGKRFVCTCKCFVCHGKWRFWIAGRGRLVSE
jgi:hypothetical protein